MSSEFRTFERRSKKALAKGERKLTVVTVKVNIISGRCFVEGNLLVEEFGDGGTSTMTEGAFRSVSEGCIKSDVPLKDAEQSQFLKTLNDNLAHVLSLRGVKETPPEFVWKKVKADG